MHWSTTHILSFPRRNGNKFEELYIHSSVPTELDSIRSMSGNISEEQALVISFLAGANAGQLAKFSTALETNKLMHSAADPLVVFQPIKVKEAATDTYNKFGTFYDLMIEKMKLKNQDMFDGITGENGSLLFNKVAKQTWQKFQPLTEEEVLTLL